ncbi:MAG TPA: PAS domain S-box protein, partial [Polyangiaceae bacterium]|nr:PAS domain S-box protein [Polyangiaceae bacterium]
MSRVLAGCIFALGVSVMAGWLLGVPAMVQVLPGMMGMVFNTAFLFALFGAALLVPSHVSWRAQLHGITAGVAIAVSSLVFSQYVLRTNLGIDTLACRAWLVDSNPNPGRMAPSTCVAFVLAGLVLLIMHRRASRSLRLAVRVLIASLCALAVIGAAGYALRLDFLFDWLRVTRMAQHTTVGLLLLGLALRDACQGLPAFREAESARGRRAIDITSTVILTGVALTAGIAGFSSMQYASEQATGRALSLALEFRIDSMEAELERQIQQTRALAAKPTLRAALRTRAKPDIRAELERLFTSSYGYLAVVDPSGRVLAELGHDEPGKVEVLLEARAPMSLCWHEGLSARLEVPLVEGDESFGILRARVALPESTSLLERPRAVGKSATFDLCTPQAENMLCFPRTLGMRGASSPFWRQNHLVPIGRALQGQSGVLADVVDSRGKPVVAAYRPFPKAALGAVLKVDADELYAPIANRLQHMLPLLLAVIVGGVLLLRSNVSPLIRQLVSSEQRALSAIREVMRGERQTRAIVDSVSDAIIILDQYGVIASFNPAAVRIFGYEAGEAIGETLALVLSSDSHEKYNAELLRSAPDGERSGLGLGSMELEARSKRGTVIDVELTINEIRAGDRRFFVAVLRDVSERRRIERMKNEFVATVSHELRTPLTSIRGSLGLIAGGVLGPVPSEVQRLVGIAHDKSERLVRLINDILDIEKIEAGRMQFRFDAAELKALVQRAIDATLGDADEFGVSFELESEFV